MHVTIVKKQENMLSERSQTYAETHKHILKNSIHMKYPEKVNPLRQNQKSDRQGWGKE